MARWVISSSALILVVITLRFASRRKINPCFRYALWGLVLLRLLAPVNFGVSPLSVMNVVPNTVSTAALARIEQMLQPEQALPYDLLGDVTSETLSPGAPEGVSAETGRMPEPLDTAQAAGGANAGNIGNAGNIANTENVGNTGNVASVGGVANVGKGSEGGVVGVRRHSVDWRSFAQAVWLTGLAAVGMFLLITNLKFSLQLEKDRAAIRVAGYPLPIYVSSLVETPCLFGLLRPAIYVTEEARRDETVFRHVLEHEATHYRHGDHIWAALRGVCLALHWYNPFVWWAASLSVLDSELACDEGTIRRMGEGARVEYGRSLISMTSMRKISGTVFSTATTMSGSGNNLRERIELIANRRKSAPCMLAVVVLVSALAACCTFTGANGALPNDPSSGAGGSDPAAAVYTIMLDNVPLYGPHGMRTEPPTDESDIVEVFAEAESDGARMMFYRARDGDIWGALQRADGRIHRFIQAYDDNERWGYETGFTVEPFQGLFGRDGFVMGCSFGASYHAFDYYYVNDGGDVELLAACINSHSVVDLDGNGSPELLHFVYMGGRICPRFYAERDGRLIEVDVVSHLHDTFLGWSDVWSDESVSQDADGPYLALSFRLVGKEEEYVCKVRYVGGALAVEVPGSTIPPDGVAWLVEREDYQVGLRNDGDKTDILLQRGEVLTVLDSLQSNTNTGWRYSLRPFDAISELSGFVVESVAPHGWGYYRYYAVRGDSAICFAESFGAGGADIVRDLDGDGTPELICGVVFGADGVAEVLVYKMKDGVPQVASVKDAVLSIPEGKYLVHPASVTYDASTGFVTLEYLIAGEDDFRVETAPHRLREPGIPGFHAVGCQTNSWGAGV